MSMRKSSDLPNGKPGAEPGTGREGSGPDEGWAHIFLLFGVLAAPIVTIVVLPGTYFPYITGKAFLFRTLVDVMFPTCALLVVAQNPRRFPWSPISTVFALLVVFTALANLAGVNACRSFWGNFERMDGWVALAHLFAFYLMLSAILRSDATWRLFWCVATVVSFAICAAALTEAFHGDAVTDETGRLNVFFGNPAYLAIYLLQGVFVTGLAASLCVRATPPRWRGLLLGLALVIATSQAVALMFTGTRAGAVGLLAGLFVAVCSLSIDRIRIAPQAWKATFGGAALAVAGATLALAGWVRFNPAFSRLPVQSFQDFQIQARLMNWKLAWRGFLDRPALGWGQENYRYVFEKFYEPAYYDPQFRLDRPHNVILDWALAGGLPALLLYLGLFLSAAVILLRNKGVTSSERALLLGLLAGYLVSNLFMFDNLATYVTFAAVLAFIQFRGRAERPKPQEAAKPLQSGAIAVTLVVGAILAAALNWNAARSNFALAIALDSEPSQQLDRFADALGFHSFAAEDIRRQLIRTAAHSMTDPAYSVTEHKALYKFAAAEMDKQIADDPLYSSPYLLAGALRNAARRFAPGTPYLLKALELAPKDQLVMLYLAINIRGRGDKLEAEALFCRAYDLDRSIVSLKAFCKRAG